MSSDRRAIPPSAEHLLDGCAPRPLIGYLKALGIFRLLTGQFDPGIRGCWRGDSFVIESRHSLGRLIQFFIEEYVPTVIIAPWSAASGFGGGSRRGRRLLELVRETQGERFAGWREAIGTAAKLAEADSPGAESKLEFLRSVRGECKLEWMDAALAISGERVIFSPLFGSGGNDGRLDFTVSFLERLTMVLPEFLAGRRGGGRLAERSRRNLEAAMLARVSPCLENGPVGQFDPGSSGVNTTEGVSGSSWHNPWEFILAIEGALWQRSERTDGYDRFAWTVRHPGIGMASISRGEPGRGETWMPIWRSHSTADQVGRLFRQPAGGGSGRGNATSLARVVSGEWPAEEENGRPEALERYVFLARNGQCHFAIPAGRHVVSLRPLSRRLEEIDRWMEALRRAVAGRITPHRIALAAGRLEEAVFRLASEGSPACLREVLMALGAVVRLAGGSRRFRIEHRLPALQLLDEEWAAASDDDSEEFDLAAAVASLRDEASGSGVREAFEPVRNHTGVVRWSAGSLRVPPQPGQLCASLLSINRWAGRQRASRQWGEPISFLAARPARLSSIAAFLDHAIDEPLAADLLAGLSLVRWSRTAVRQPPRLPAPLPDLYAFLKLATLIDDHSAVSDEERSMVFHRQTIDSPIVSLLLAGRHQQALAVAGRRVMGRRGRRLERDFPLTREEGRRLALALMIPLETSSVSTLRQQVAD